jgi:hypothetical protein
MDRWLGVGDVVAAAIMGRGPNDSSSRCLRFSSCSRSFCWRFNLFSRIQLILSFGKDYCNTHTCSRVSGRFFVPVLGVVVLVDGFLFSLICMCINFKHTSTRTQPSIFTYLHRVHSRRDRRMVEYSECTSDTRCSVASGEGSNKRRVMSKENGKSCHDAKLQTKKVVVVESHPLDCHQRRKLESHRSIPTIIHHRKHIHNKRK